MYLSALLKPSVWEGLQADLDTKALTEVRLGERDEASTEVLPTGMLRTARRTMGCAVPDANKLTVEVAEEPTCEHSV